MGNRRLAFSFIECAFFSRFRESAKIAFAQARKKLAVCQKNANYEDGLVRNLEMAGDVLLNAKQTHLERDLQQVVSAIALFSSVVHSFSFCRCYTG